MVSRWDWRIWSSASLKWCAEADAHPRGRRIFSRLDSTPPPPTRAPLCPCCLKNGLAVTALSYFRMVIPEMADQQVASTDQNSAPEHESKPEEPKAHEEES